MSGATGRGGTGLGAEGQGGASLAVGRSCPAGNCPTTAFPVVGRREGVQHGDTQSAGYWSHSARPRCSHTVRYCCPRVSNRANIHVAPQDEMMPRMRRAGTRGVSLARRCGTISDPCASARHCREERPTNACASRRPRPLGLESASPRTPRQEWRSLVHPLPRRRTQLTRIQGRR